LEAKTPKKKEKAYRKRSESYKSKKGVVDQFGFSLRTPRLFSAYSAFKGFNRKDELLPKRTSLSKNPHRLWKNQDCLVGNFPAPAHPWRWMHHLSGTIFGAQQGFR